MNDFGFLPDNTLDIEQAWANAASGGPVVLSEPSKPFGGRTGIAPHASGVSYTNGHVREDRLKLDANGFVADNTFTPQGASSFSDWAISKSGFGFLPDNSLDIGQAWADAEGGGPAALSDPSRPFGRSAGEVPHAADARDTTGHVREDRVSLNSKGLVAGNASLARESVSFLDAVGSGADYLKEKLKAKGWSGVCCGSCAGGSDCGGNVLASVRGEGLVENAETSRANRLFGDAGRPPSIHDLPTMVFASGSVPRAMAADSDPCPGCKAKMGSAALAPLLPGESIAIYTDHVHGECVERAIGFVNAPPNCLIIKKCEVTMIVVYRTQWPWIPTVQLALGGFWFLSGLFPPQITAGMSLPPGCDDWDLMTIERINLFTGKLVQVERFWIECTDCETP